jgi:hypothetical protein
VNVSVDRISKVVSQREIRYWVTYSSCKGWVCILFYCQLLALKSVSFAQPVSNDSVMHRCGTVEFERVLQQHYPARRLQLDKLNQQIQQLTSLSKQARLNSPSLIFRIPVVVHVVYATASSQIGGANNPNISDQQIISQIQVLNEDYRHLSNTSGARNPEGNDSGIEFFLAQTDPKGQSTSGITRHYYPQQTSFQVDNLTDARTLSQIVDWPSDRYLNIWVTTLQGNFLGYTQFPTVADTTRGLDMASEEAIDGTIIDYRYFGRQIGTVSSSVYGYGRTTTHEVGHWLGLIHTWGDAVCGDDYVADTPRCEGPNQTVRCQPLFSTCAGEKTRNLIEDYMDYSPDQCMSLFTPGQIARMRAVLQLSPRRVRLIQSVVPLAEAETLTVTLQPNPIKLEATVYAQFKGIEAISLRLYDTVGRSVRGWQYPSSSSLRVGLSVEGLPPGIYLLQVSTSHETTRCRLVVQ